MRGGAYIDFKSDTDDDFDVRLRSLDTADSEPGGIQVSHTRNETGSQNALQVNATDAASGTYTGAYHGIGIAVDFKHDFVADEEGAGLYNKLTGTGSGTLWSYDTLLFGPTAKQSTKMVGLSQFIANRHTDSVNSVGISISTNREGEGPAEIASTQTYTNQAGLVITGLAGDATGTDPGFKYGFLIGDWDFGGWYPDGLQSKFTYGGLIDSYTDAGLVLGQPYSGTAPYLVFSGSAFGNDHSDANGYLEIVEESDTIVFREPHATDDIWFMTFDSGGAVTILGGADATGSLTIGDDHFIVSSDKTPATAAEACTKGTICYDDDYIYVCTATNTWKRSALTTW